MWFDDKTSKIRAVAIYIVAIILGLFVHHKFSDRQSVMAIVLLVCMLFVYFAGMLLRAPVFGKNIVSWYGTSKRSYNTEAVKAADTEILSNYYGYSKAESRAIIEQRATNRLLEEMLDKDK